METMDPMHGPEGCSSPFLDNPGDIFEDLRFSLEPPDFEFLDFDNQDMKSGSEALYSLEDTPHVGIFSWTESLVSTYASTNEERCEKGLGHQISQASMVPSSKLTRASKSKKSDAAGAPQCAQSGISGPTKRKWDDSMIVFPVAPNEEMDVRTRKTYSPVRRKQVALNRLLGACIQCRVRKGSVSIILLEMDLG